MAKMDFAKLMLEKGEKVVLGLAGLGMVGLIGLGVSNAFSGQDPKAFADAVKAKAAQIKTQTVAKGEDATAVPALPAWVSEPYVQKVLPPAQFEANRPFFDPIATPSSRRTNPVVLGVTEFQADPVHAKLYCWDVKLDNLENPEQGWIVPKLKGSEQMLKLQEPDRNRLIYIPPANFANRGNGAPGMGRPPGGAPPGGAPSGGRSGVGGVGASGPPGLGNPGAPAAPGATSASTDITRNTVQYISIFADPQPKGLVKARTVYPQRMVVLNASFPYKQQIERVREALRLESVRQVYESAENVPTFSGVNVQRRTLMADGKTPELPERGGEWTTLAWEDALKRNIFRRSCGEQPENPDLKYVKLDRIESMWIWLPRLMSGQEYPALKIPSLLATIKSFKEFARPAAVPRSPNSKLGEGNLYDPPADADASPGGPGGSGMGGEVGGPGMGVPGMGVPGMGVPGMGRPGMGGPGREMNNFDPSQAGGLQNLANSEPPESVLVRIIDVQVEPNRKYQYRIQVKMKNPNYKKGPELVTRNSDAEIKELLGEWVEMPGTVTFPPETHLYAVDMSGGRRPAEGQAFLQFQRWMEKVNLGTGFDDWVGDWVISEVLVNRGQMVGGKQLVPLPLWSAEDNRYKIGDDTAAIKGGPGQNRIRGVSIDPTYAMREKFLIVDIDGGRRRRLINNKNYDDECATEILMMDVGTGQLQMLTSSTESQARERKEREENWRKWITETENKAREAPTAAGPGSGEGPGRFDR